MSLLAAAGAVVALGLAGMDPFSALIVVAALASGARRRVAVLFFAAMWATTVIAGVVVGLSVQRLGSWVSTSFTLAPAPRIAIELVAAVALAIWAVSRWRHRGEEKPEKRRSFLTRTGAMTLAGAGWGLSSMSDPTFYGVAAVGVSLGAVFSLVLLYTLWFLVSQAPLVVVVIALRAGLDSGPVAKAITFVERIRGPIEYLMTALLALTAVAAVVNVASYLATGTFWPA